MRYKTIVFDLGNTLIRFDHNISARKIADSFKLDLKKVYDLFFDSEMTRAFETGSISETEFHKRIMDHLGVSLPYDDFVKVWNDIFWEDAEMTALARSLKGRYKLFLLSNVNRLHFEYIKNKFGMMDIFDEVILSFLVGAMKPDKKIFDDVVRRAGGDKRTILYIDDREDLVKEALSLGIDSIRYEGTAKLKRILKDKGIDIEAPQHSLDVK